MCVSEIEALLKSEKDHKIALRLFNILSIAKGEKAVEKHRNHYF